MLNMSAEVAPRRTRGRPLGLGNSLGSLPDGSERFVEGESACKTKGASPHPAPLALCLAIVALVTLRTLGRLSWVELACHGLALALLVLLLVGACILAPLLAPSFAAAPALARIECKALHAASLHASAAQPAKALHWRSRVGLPAAPRCWWCRSGRPAPPALDCGAGLPAPAASGASWLHKAS